ncbi:MAG: glycosyltransferase family 4 protein [Candidatus Terrybacteria bacterium]|nr:glycosyltransferase family 4 protein [Candidatus Terrybacteria bacterium]
MKIILATPLYPPEIGGPATYVKELCEQISGKHKIIIVAYADDAIAQSGAELIAVSKKQPLIVRLFKYFFALWKASRGADLIYVQSAVASGLPTAIAAMFRKIPFVVKFVGDEAWERAVQFRQTKKQLEEFLQKPEGGLKVKIIMAVEKFVLNRASIVTTPSFYLKETIIRAYGLKPERVIINYNAADEKEKNETTEKRSLFQVLTTARLVPHKGIDGIIRAVAILKSRLPEIKFFVAGDGPEEENLKKLTKELGVENNVVFVGRVTRLETWKLRKQSSVYVLNSTYEGLPHTVLTSFAAGIPVVATNIFGTNEAVYHEQTGLLVSLGDDKALAEAISRLLTDDKLTKRLIAGGKKILREKFSWEAHISSLMNIFKSAISRP